MEKSDFAIIISAPSGTGKTTIIKELLKLDIFEFSVSTTTRPKRNNEVKDVSYYFVSEKEFIEMIKNSEFLEYAKVHDNYYGTTKKEIDRIFRVGKIPLLDIDVQGVKQIKAQFKDGVYIFLIPPSIVELERRLRNRKTDSDEQIAIRLQNAINELNEYSMYDYIVVNDAIKEAQKTVESIVQAEKCKISRSTIMEKITPKETK